MASASMRTCVPNNMMINGHTQGRKFYHSYVAKQFVGDMPLLLGDVAGM